MQIHAASGYAGAPQLYAAAQTPTFDADAAPSIDADTTATASAVDGAAQLLPMYAVSDAGCHDSAVSDAAEGVSALGHVSGSGSQMLAPAELILGDSPIANQVFGALERYDARIDVLGDAEFAGRFGEAAGVFVPDENRIVMPESAYSDPAQTSLIMLHEGVHWLEGNVIGGAQALGGPLADALASADAIRSYQPGSKLADWHEEAQAYVAEAAAGAQLGLHDRGLGSRNGQPLSYDEIMARIAAEPIYN